MVCETAVPVAVVRLPGLVTTGAASVVQVNAVLPVRVPASVAVTVTVPEDAAVGVPVMAPVVRLIARPVGRPVAVQVYGVTPPLADMVIVAAVPIWVPWPPGLVTATAVAIAQVNVMVRAIFFASVAVTAAV